MAWGQAVKEIAHRWSPIEDLPEEWRSYVMPGLAALSRVWSAQKDRLEGTAAYRTFLERMRREIAVETGIIERLYVLDRGVTQTLIEQGIEASFIPHGASDRPVPQVIALIQDQEEAVEAVFDFVTRRQPLTKHYIRSLHQMLTRHQETVQMLDTQGRLVERDLLRGVWKQLPNSPTRRDGSVHEYCPPEHVESEMDRLVGLHRAHQEQGVPPEVEAAWLHHRFTQIHPFQDGNGRVVRCLASMVFIQGGYFPLVVRDKERRSYIEALEQADRGNLQPLVKLFSILEEEAFLRALSLSDDVLPENRYVSEIIEAVRRRVIAHMRPVDEGNVEKTKFFAAELFDNAKHRLEELEKELADSFFQIIPNFCVSVSYAYPNGPLRYLTGYQVGVIATKLGYFANRNVYSSWVRLTLKADATVGILIAFHGYGPENNGVFAAVGCAYHEKPPPGDGASIYVSLEALSLKPFQFSYEDEREELLARFKAWLDEVLATGLVYWQRDI